MLSHILLEETTRENQQREDLAMIVSEADRCKKIVSGLLQFARKNKVEAREVDLHGLVARAARTILRPANVELWIEPPKGDMTAEIDHDQIVQVLANLTSNAIAAMPDGGTLTIRTGEDESAVWFSVSDTGVGIPKENRKKVFEPFFTTKPAGQGTGLGLAVIYGVVKMHNGDIKLESNADRSSGPTGTTFTVTLPRRRRTPTSDNGTGEAEK
jgi:signal transduction histidine kinase